jgi:putative copper export protein
VDSIILLSYLHEMFQLILVQCLLSNFTPVFLFMLKCSSAHPLSCLFRYCSFAIIGHACMMCSIVLSNCLHILHLLSVSACNIFVAGYLVHNA